MNRIAKYVAVILLVAAGVFYFVGYSIDKSAISQALVTIDFSISDRIKDNYESVSNRWDKMNTNDKKEWFKDLFFDLYWAIDAHNDLCEGIFFSKYSLENMQNALLYVEDLNKDEIDALYLKVGEAYKILCKPAYVECFSVDEIVDVMILVEDVFSEE